MDDLSKELSENKRPAGSGQNSETDKVVDTDRETVYFHQYFSDREKKEFPPSLVLVQDETDGILALVREKDGGDRPKLSFKKLEVAMQQDSGHKLELFGNRDLLSAMVHNFKAGYNQTNLALDTVYVAINRPIEKIREWVTVRNQVEKDRTMFSQNEIPYSALEKIGISRGDFSQKQIDRLLKGRNTDLMEVGLKNKDIELKELPPYNIRLERSGEKVVARFTFQRDTLDFGRDKIGKALSMDEKAQLLRNGEVEIKEPTRLDSSGKANKVVWDKETNVIEYRKSGASPAEIKEVAITYDFKLDPQDHGLLRDGKRTSKESVLNPENGKREKAVVQMGSDNVLVPVFRSKELSREINREFKDR